MRNNCSRGGIAEPIRGIVVMEMANVLLVLGVLARLVKPEEI